MNRRLLKFVIYSSPFLLIIGLNNANGQTPRRVNEVDREAGRSSHANLDTYNDAAKDFDGRYTRRRHQDHREQRKLALRDYRHVDISDQFDLFGIFSVLALYVIFWMLQLFPICACGLPLGRPLVAIIGGICMIVWRYVLVKVERGPPFEVGGILFVDPLVFLCGMMMVTAYLREDRAIADKLGAILSSNERPWKRAAGIMTVAFCTSAVLMNEHAALLLAPIVLDSARTNNTGHDSLPYLLALVTGANIGASLTFTGSYQGLLISILAYDEIGWMEYTSNLAIPVIAALLIHLVWMFFYLRHRGTTPTVQPEQPELDSHRNSSPATISCCWSAAQLLVVMAFMISFALGFNVCVVSVSAGLGLATLAAVRRKLAPANTAHDNAARAEYHGLPGSAGRNDAEGEGEISDDAGNSAPGTIESLDIEEDGDDLGARELETETDRISRLMQIGPFLLLIGNFILVGSLNDTGAPQALISLGLGDCADDPFHGECLYRAVALIALLGNLVSGAPLVQMLAATLPYCRPYEWVQIAFASTIGCNITTLGYATSQVVADQAKMHGDTSYTWMRHTQFTIFPTLVSLLFGASWLFNFHTVLECSETLGECY